MSDDGHGDNSHHDDEDHPVPLLMSRRRERQLYNLLDASSALQSFSPEQKIALISTLENAEELGIIVKGRLLRRAIRRKLYYFFGQFAGLVALAEAVNVAWELWLKTKGPHP